jgi:hypothetical protein
VKEVIEEIRMVSGKMHGCPLLSNRSQKNTVLLYPTSQVLTKTESKLYPVFIAVAQSTDY